MDIPAPGVIPDQVMLLHSAGISTLQNCPLALNELASKMTSSDDPGMHEPAAPPLDVDQLFVSDQLPEFPPIQYKVVGVCGLLNVIPELFPPSAPELLVNAAPVTLRSRTKLAVMDWAALNERLA